MKTSWHDIWGSANGPATALAPQTRIICGASAFAVCMVSPVTNWQGVAAITGVLVLWEALVRPPARVIRSTLLLGLVLFLPYFLLTPLIHKELAEGDWSRALLVSWSVFFRGMTSMQASVSTATALSASDLRQGCSRLPIPRVFRAVLIQIVQQIANLVYETQRVASAIAVRGGTTGYRAGIKVVTSLPRVWLPRVIERAERVGAAMELRGYCERDIEQLGVIANDKMDYLANTLAVITLAAAALLRFGGGA
jgi:energy-coupling factor transporter transmembrane protein EcfT